MLCSSRPPSLIMWCCYNCFDRCFDRQLGPYCNCCMWLCSQQTYVFILHLTIRWLSNDCFVLQGKHANHTEHLPPEGYGKCTPLSMFTLVDCINIKGIHIMKNAFSDFFPYFDLFVSNSSCTLGLCRGRTMENYNQKLFHGTFWFYIL